MTDNIKKSDKVWGWFGKVSLIIVTIWAFIQLLNFFSPETCNLKAYGSYQDYYLPEFNQKAIEKGQESIFIAGEKPRYISVFSLKNDDNEEINNIKLQLPFDGFYAIVQEHETKYQSFSKFSKIIPLGTLPPSNKIKIVVWYNSPLSLQPYGRFDDNYRFTYPNGVIKIEFPLEIYGVKAWIVENLWTFVFLIPFFCSCVILLYNLFRIDRNQTKLTKSLRQDTSAQKSLTNGETKEQRQSNGLNVTSSFDEYITMFKSLKHRFLEQEKFVNDMNKKHIIWKGKVSKVTTLNNKVMVILYSLNHKFDSFSATFPIDLKADLYALRLEDVIEVEGILNTGQMGSSPDVECQNFKIITINKA